MLKANDKDNDGVISWAEFVEMQIKLKGADSAKFGTVVETKSGAVAQVAGAHDGIHSYAIEEKVTFAKMINNILKDDEDCKDRLPMNADDDSLFHVFDNGVLLCKLLLQIDQNIIDTRTINRKANMNVYEVKENLNQAIAASKGLGIKMVGIDTNAFINKVPHLVLGSVWQSIRLCLAKKIQLRDTPEIIRLLKDGEELKDLLKLSPETILIRWVNYHLEKAG